MLNIMGNMLLKKKIFLTFYGVKHYGKYVIENKIFLTFCGVEKSSSEPRPSLPRL